jgi:hypothetical protein
MPGRKLHLRMTLSSHHSGLRASVAGTQQHGGTAGKRSWKFGQGIDPRPSTMTRVLLVLVSCCLCAVGHCALPERFFDPSDGAFDLSQHLLEHSGFLPVPLIITEPALGYGGGAAIVYFDEAMSSKNRGRSAADRLAPPNITALGGFKTENGSWGGGAGLFRSWDDDRFRYLGGLGKVALNLDFYGPLDRPRRFELEGVGLVQQLSMRLADSDWLIGGRYVLFKAQSEFRVPLPDSVRSAELDVNVGKLGLVLSYDGRDNILTPNRGSFFEMELSAARAWLGSSWDFENLAVRAFHYEPLGESLVLGLRGDFQSVTDGTPFFALPYIGLRGIPALRYQDRRTAVVETELRWNVTARWALVGFIGAGRDFGRYQDFSDADTVISRGAGIRYLLARSLGLYAGLDVARGPEDDAFYIQVGSAWR